MLILVTKPCMATRYEHKKAVRPRRETRNLAIRLKFVISHLLHAPWREQPRILEPPTIFTQGSRAHGGPCLREAPVQNFKGKVDRQKKKNPLLTVVVGILPSCSGGSGGGRAYPYNFRVASSSAPWRRRLLSASCSSSGIAE